MRLLWTDADGQLCLTVNLQRPPGPYAILSHTWGADHDEVNFDDVQSTQGQHKSGYAKVRFCADRAKQDGFDYFWIDTCCICKRDFTELSEAITSMFAWYRSAEKCYVYLPDVSVACQDQVATRQLWQNQFLSARHHSRAWTLQEVLAPKIVEFFTREGFLLGSKHNLEDLLHQCTNIPLTALRGRSLQTFSIEERLRWTEGRNASKAEDRAYCLLGIFGVFMPLIYGEGENAFHRLRSELKKEEEPPSWLHTYWKVPRTPNPLFTGREDILRELHFIIARRLANLDQQQQCCIVITGIGGQGKSEICLQLAHLLRSRFWGVFWVDVSSVQVAEKSFLELSRSLNISVDKWEDAITSIANLKHPWLLILDNADQPDVDYQSYIPSSTVGVVMITSRNEETEQYSTSEALPLSQLPSLAAQHLLLRAAHIPGNQHVAMAAEASQVTKLLHGHPLALLQAGAYISRGHCRLDQYADVYEKHRRRLLQYRPSQARSRYGDVYAGFEAAVDVLLQSQEQSAADALQLLSLLAVCGTDRFPLNVFASTWVGAQDADQDNDPFQVMLTSQHTFYLPEFLRHGLAADSYDNFQLMEAVQLLKSFSIIAADLASGYAEVSLHPLVHAWARDRQTTEEMRRSWLSMACCLAFAMRCTSWGSRLHRQLQDHIDQLFLWEPTVMFGTGSQPLVVSAIATCAKLWNMRQLHNRINYMTSKVISWLGFRVDRFENSLRDLYVLHAWSLNLDMPTDAINLLREILEVNHQTELTTQPPYLETHACLALSFNHNGESAEATALMENVVSVAERVLPATNISLLNVKQDLAVLYRQGRHFDKCIKLCEAILLDAEGVLEQDDEMRLLCLELKAYSYVGLKRFLDALSLRETIGKVKQQALLFSVEEVLRSQNELALSYIHEGRYEDAITLLKSLRKDNRSQEPAASSN